MMENENVGAAARMYIAQEIRALIDSQGRSIRGVARALGIAPAQLMRVVNGKENYTIGLLVKILNYLDVSIAIVPNPLNESKQVIKYE